jgi:hypothetical protein
MGAVMRILIGICLILFAFAGQAVCDTQLNVKKKSLQSVPVQKPVDIQSELEALAGTSEDIFDLAAISKWHKISKKMDELKKHQRTINMLWNGENNYFEQRLTLKIDKLDQAVAAKSSLDVRVIANDITFLEIAMIGELKPGGNTNIMLLGYCGRELEILSEKNDLDKLNILVIRIHLIWQNLIPQLVDKNASKEIRSFSEIMKHLEKAKTPEEYSQSARHVLEEVSNIEQILRKHPKR